MGRDELWANGWHTHKNIGGNGHTVFLDTVKYNELMSKLLRL